MGLFARKPPAIQLSGLVCSPDGLYDGTFVAACAHWWNRELAANAKRMVAAGYRPFRPDEVSHLQAVVQPENRNVFEAIASFVSIPGRHSSAVLCLSYSIALVASVGASQARVGDAESAWRQAPPFSEDDVVELARHYNGTGAAAEYEKWMPFWVLAPSKFAGENGSRVVASARLTFDDQVNRWSGAEGLDLRNGVGPLDFSLVTSRPPETLRQYNFVELLFEWGGRLWVGERFLADGLAIEDVRFSHDKVS